MSIDYKKELNPAQWEAVRTLDGPVLVIAGAGSGKTRTIVYRLTHLMDQGVDSAAILLLTFTRKAAREMLERAGLLMERAGLHGSLLHGVTGGTFHAFAYSTLRRFPPEGYSREFTIMDRSDAESVIKEVKGGLGLGKGDRSYPKSGTIMGFISKSRNKELDVREVLERDAFHLTAYAEDVKRIAQGYETFKRGHGLMDYDDLLTEFERLLTTRPEVLESHRNRFRFIMVDEYQDTNLIQSRLVKLLAGPSAQGGGNIMAVGDDAQSIYAFRGANVHNILGFPHEFPGCKVIKLEQNYRSTQPILNLTNAILAESGQQFKKELYTERVDGPMPQVIRPLSDLTQSRMVAARVVELLKVYPADEIAVLFRAGYQSYHVEMELAKLGIAFRKYGGMKYTEAAHVKDVLAYVRLVCNVADLPAWQRVMGHIKGIGVRTVNKLYDAIITQDEPALEKAFKRWPDLKGVLDALDGMRRQNLRPADLLEQILEFYDPVFKELYPDDHPKRKAGLDELVTIASAYEEPEVFLADLSLENPGPDEGREGEGSVTLSTIHSAKGLEWQAVCIIDLVEERFPSRHALQRADDFDEERRLMYVACTRAKEYLGLFVPSALYRRGQESTEPAVPSPFVKEIAPYYYEELRESYVGGLFRAGERARATGGNGAERPDPDMPAADAAESPDSAAAGPAPAKPKADPLQCGFCRHSTFGRGKIVELLPPNKYRINFPGIGLKVIMGDFLEME
ncbi:MAG: ATP-dependent helicase [Desulfovibrionaceae bacterium]